MAMRMKSTLVGHRLWIKQDPNMRHSAVLVRKDRLHVFYTRAGDAPERILHATIDLTADWTAWRESEPAEVRRAERRWEGAALPVSPSIRGSSRC